MTTDRETEIADLLAGHRYDGFNRVPDKPGEWCKCDGAMIESWAAHVAAVLAAYITDREAEAWDAGRAAVSTYALREYDAMVATDPMPKPPANPFRFTPDTEGQSND